MDGVDTSEPVRVYVRVRPEFDNGHHPEKSSVAYNNPNAKPAPSTCCSVLDAQTLKLMPPDGVYGSRKSVAAVDDKLYTFDKIFNESCTQEDIYADVAEHVQATVRGYNTTIFAYGTTGSGKSYTMTGNKIAPGIIPRAIGDLFRHIENAAAGESDVFFYIRLSYVELYNNNFRNLLENVSKVKLSTGKSNRSLNTSVNISMNGFFNELDSDADTGLDPKFGPSFAAARNSVPFTAHPGLAHRTDKIEVRESQSAGVFLAGPNLRIPVTSAIEAFQLIAKGNKLRATGATACNDVSSRSHAILTLHVESRITSSSLGKGDVEPFSSSGAKSELRLGKMHLVDLAGSERLSLSGAEGDTRLETQQINLSLTALGDVLSALSKNAAFHAQQQRALSKSTDQSSGSGMMDNSFLKQHIAAQVPVPYRNSKLTHLLKDSLGGNSKTVMITTIRTSDEYYQQTAISLMYASRAKKVRNRSLVNRNVIGDTGIHAVSSEIDRLKKSLEERSKEFERLRVAQLMDAQENSSLKLRLQEMKTVNDSEKKLLENQVSQVIHSQAGHIASQREKITALQSALQDELTLSQNRIAEQEKEIKWLKKALDETSLAAQGPHDQLQRLQLMVDAWQSQAKTTHQELSTVLKQAEELKVMNAQLASKLTEAEAAKLQLQEEISERTQETTDYSNETTKLLLQQEQLVESNKAILRAYEEAKEALKTKVAADLQKELVLKENTKLISSLEKELTATREAAASSQSSAAQSANRLSTRVRDLETEKAELTSRLNNAISTLEKSTTKIVDDANAKIQLKDSKIKQSDEDIRLLKSEREHLTKLLEEYKRQKETSAAESEKCEADLRAELRTEKSSAIQSAAQISSMHDQMEGFRQQLLVLKTSDKAVEERLSKEVEQLSKEVREKDRALKTLEEQRDAERLTLMTEFERVLEEKKLKSHAELCEARSKAAFSSEAVRALEQQHAEELDGLQREYSRKEKDFRKQLSDAQVQMKELIDKEILETMRRLEDKHRSDAQKERDRREEELRAAVRDAVGAAQKAAHQQHILELEQQNSAFQAELATVSNNCSMQLAATEGEARAQKESLLASHDKQIEQLHTAHLQAQKQLEVRLSLQYEQYYDEQMKLIEERSQSSRVKEVEQERVKLVSHYDGIIQSLKEESHMLKERHEQSLKNIELQRELMAHELVGNERSRLLILNRDQLDEQRAALTSSFTEQLEEQKRQLEARFQQQLEHDRQLTMGEHEKMLQQTAVDQQKTIDSLLSQMKDAEEHHQREADLLQLRYKKELSEAKREFDVLQRTRAAEFESQVDRLREQFSERQVEHAELSQRLLADQQKELLDRHRNESVRLRAEVQDMEARHQEELSAAMQEHIQELSKQRKSLEASHSKYIDSLQEEVKQAKDRITDLMSQSASREARDAALLADQKDQLDDVLRRALDDQDKKHQLALEVALSFNSSEVAKMRGTIAKLKANFEADLSGVQRELEGEHQQAVRLLQDKQLQLVSELQKEHEQELAALRQEADNKNRLAQLRFSDEQMARDLEYQVQQNEAERKIRELTQAMHDQRVDFDRDSARLLENNKSSLLLQQVRDVEFSAKLEALQVELENRHEAKHKAQLNALRDEYEGEALRVREEAQAVQSRRDSLHQRELAALQKAAEEQEALHFSAVEELKGMLKQQIHASTTDLNRLQLELEASKKPASLEISRLQMELATSKERYEDELLKKEASCQREVSSVKKASDSEVHAVRIELETVRRNSSAELNRLQLELDSCKGTFEEEMKHARLLISNATEQHHHYKQEAQRLSEQLLDSQEQSSLKLAAREKEYRVALDAQAARHAEELREGMAGLTRELQAAAEELRRRDDLSRLELQRLTDSRVSAEFHWEGELQQCRREYEDRLAEMERTNSSSMESMRSDRDRIEQQLRTDLRDEQLAGQAATAALEAAAGSIEALQLKVQEAAAQLRSQEEEFKTTMTGWSASREEQVAQLTRALSASEQRTASVEAALTRELDRSRRREEELVDDLSALQAQGQANVLAERVMKANEIDELKVGLQLAHRKELQALQEVVNNTDRERQAALDALSLLEEERDAQLKSMQQELDKQREHHRSEAAQLQKRHSALLKESAEEKGSELVAAQRQLMEKDEELREAQRQLSKGDAIREVLRQDLESMRAERQQLRERVHLLEMELIENGKAKFEARLTAERDRIETSCRSAVEESKRDAAAKADENRELVVQLQRAHSSVEEVRATVSSLQLEKERVESAFRDMLADKDASFEAELRKALDNQQQELQGGYLKMIQQQVEALMEIMQRQQTAQAANPIEDLQQRFLSLVQDLPDFWQQKYGKGVFAVTDPGPNPVDSLPPHPHSFPPHPHQPQGKKQQSEDPPPGKASAYPRTPLHLLGQAVRDSPDIEPSDAAARKMMRPGNRQSLPWSSPSLRSSPSDQLIAAILDGDVQGIRAVVRSKGDDLRSDFWREVARSVLPLHRAVSGLHFHGSEKLLVATIDSLALLGSDVNATDHAGNSVLHKAIQVCTSKSVAAVVNTLLRRGANPSLKNKDGDYPLHSECKRIRSASVEVIEALVSAGADPNVRNNSIGSATPLTLVLLRGAASTNIGLRLIGNSEELGLSLRSDSSAVGLSFRKTTADESFVEMSGSSSFSLNNNSNRDRDSSSGGPDQERNRGIAGKRVWIKAAEMLLRAGAHFDVEWKTNKGCTQLHLLLASFPPSREDCASYKAVLKRAVDAGLEAFAVESEGGLNALFILCHQMAIVSSDLCPDAASLVQLILRGSTAGSASSNYTISTTARRLVNSIDPSGRTVLDIVEKIDHSCLSACRSLLRDASRGILSSEVSSAAIPTRKSSSSSGGDDWEMDHHSRMPPALLPTSRRLSGDKHRQGETELKQRAHYGRGASSSSYFDDDPDTDPQQVGERYLTSNDFLRGLSVGGVPLLRDGPSSGGSPQSRAAVKR